MSQLFSSYVVIVINGFIVDIGSSDLLVLYEYWESLLFISGKNEGLDIVIGWVVMLLWVPS